MEIHEIITDIIEIAAFVLEAISVFYIVAAVIVGTIRFLYLGFVKREKINLVNQYRTHVAGGLLLGLDILIAADIVRTVALEMTITNLLALGLLVLIRTFLSWSLVVEIEGRWPWQPKKEESV